MADFREELETRQYSFKDIAILKKFGVYFRPYLRRFIIVLIASVLCTCLFNIEPLILSYVLDFLEQPEGEKTIQMILALIFGDMMAMLIASIGSYFFNLELKKIGQYVVYDIRNSLFKKIISFSQGQLKGLPIGSYVTRITNDTQNLSSLFSDVLPQAIRSSASLLTIIIISFSAVKLYGFIYLAYIPIVFLISYFFRKRARVYYRKEKRSVSEMNSFLSESFSGIRVTKTYARENRKQIEFDRANEEIKSSYLKSQNMFAVFYPMMYLLQMSCVLLIMGFGIPAMYQGTLTTGDFNLLYSYSTQFFSPVQTITQLLNQLQQIISSAERTQVINEIEPEIEDEEDAIDVPSFCGKIEFRHVYFSYTHDKGDYVLKDVSFTINPGQTAAFVGATGAGKSTIISLISRTYEVDSGEILIDDVDIRHYRSETLRRNIGIMLQDVFLFSGSIASNISLDDESISRREIEDAARYTAADTFIDKLPDKFDEYVTQRGENLSVGQKQLISFSRTLVYHPSVILLDEATSNIDTETEKIIQDNIEKMKNIGTMVIVAHRLATIRNADVIFVVSRGEIIERGDHEELLKRRGTYYNLYRLQNLSREISYGSEKRI